MLSSAAIITMQLPRYDRVITDAQDLSSTAQSVSTNQLNKWKH